FTKKYPKISFHLHPVMSASRDQISKGYADFSIIAHEIGCDKELIALPAYLWTLSLVVPPDHPLAHISKPTLAQLCEYPILSYESGATGRQVQDEVFEAAGLTPSYYMTVMDAGVIRRYVELGFGIGIISSLVADDPDATGLVSINLEHLFKPCPAQICFSKSILLQNYMYDFISSFSPHLTKEVIQSVMLQPTSEHIAQLLAEVELPIY
ncbi:MAG: LysR substrate-binding domain-containing protein, partial [Aeromonas sp.]